MKIIKNAFTLSETLITLGIIGAIAAMTIPTLNNHLRGKKLQSQFMKTYSELNQASRNFYAETDVTFRDYQDSIYTGAWDSTESLRVFMSYFKGQTKENNASAAGFDLKNNIKNRNLNNQVIDNKYPCDQSAVFSDMVGRTYSMDDNAAAYRNFSHGPKICVDINGKDRPNKWGVDRFVFVFTEDNAVVPYTGSQWFTLLGHGTLTEEQLKEYCSTSTESPVHTCAYFALKNKSPEGVGDYWYDFLKDK